MTQSTILIVDDIQANRETLEDLLDYPELQLHAAADGPAALALAAKLQPDLILLDVMMPGMDGYEVCTRLRADPQLADVPILMVTSLDDRESRLRGIEAGADDFITKPFDRTELRARVRGILRLNRFRRMQQASQRIYEQAALIDLAPDAIIVCSLSQRITHWNPAAERLYGWKADEIIGQRVNELLLFDQTADAPKSQPISNDSWQREVTHATRDGREIVVESHRKLLRDSEGQPTSILMINTDLTEKKLREQQYQRTQRLESVGNLASGIVHDLNNILGPIMLSVELLRMRIDGEENEDVLGIIESCAQRGADLIRQILAFTSGTGSKKTEIQLRHLVDAIVKMLRGAFPSNITIKTEIPRELWTVVGNATQFDQIIMNLSVNARDAMQDGGELRISMENVTLSEENRARVPSAQPGTYVRITVADTGAGMAPEVVARIFDTFFTTKQEDKGTGLGLATVQSIVKGHGGIITVDSAVNVGSAFQVYLPAVPNLAGTSSEHGKITNIPRGNGECVLVVENDEGVRAMTTATLEHLLEHFGFKTHHAADGLEALERFTQHRQEIRAILADTEMPQIDGLILAQVMHDLAPKIPILLMSGSDEYKDLKIKANIAAFVKKPFAAVDLIKAIHRALLSAPR